MCKFKHRKTNGLRIGIPNGCAHALISNLFFVAPRAIIRRTRLAAAKCNMQLSSHVLPKTLAVAGCGEHVIYVSAAALTNATYALPAVKHLSRK